MFAPRSGPVLMRRGRVGPSSCRLSTLPARPWYRPAAPSDSPSRLLRLAIRAPLGHLRGGATAPAEDPVLDVLLRNARIIDGSGNAWYRGDVGVQGEKIVAVGRAGTADAARVIDCGDRVV